MLLKPKIIALHQNCIKLQYAGLTIAHADTLERAIMMLPAFAGDHRPFINAHNGIVMSNTIEPVLQTGQYFFDRVLRDLYDNLVCLFTYSYVDQIEEL